MRLLLGALVTLAALTFAQTRAAWQDPLARRQWAEAEPLLKAALAEGETAPALRGLATVYRATGRIDAAEPILERLVALDGSVANIEDLARIKAGLGRLDQAEALYRSSLALRLNEDSDPLASIPVLGRLAQVLVAEKNFPAAEQEAAASIALRMRVVGANHPDLAGNHALLARIFQVQKKWQDAANAWETVAAIQGTAFGYEDLRIADTLDNLATCRVEMRLFDQAESALRQALVIRESNLGPSNAEVAATTDQLGKVLYTAKRFSDAEPFFRRTLSIYMRLLGSDNPAMAPYFDNLAVTEAMLEKYVESEAFYREALKLRDTDDALSLRNLALVLIAQKKNSEAQPLYSRALDVLDAGNQNSDLLPVILTEYADVLRDLKRPADAAKLDLRLKAGKPLPQGKRPPVAAKQ